MVYDGETAGELTEDLVRALRDAVKCSLYYPPPLFKTEC